MKTNQSQNRIGNAFLVFSMLFGIGIALSMTAQAQNPDDRYTQDRNRSDTEIKIDMVATGIVTVTTAALQSCVAPL